MRFYLSAVPAVGARWTGVIAGLFFVLGSPALALADIAPPQTCTAPGQPCQNAGPASNQGGTCTASTCQRSVHLPDGGVTSMSYQCNLCSPGSGTGGNGGAGSGGRAGSGGMGGANTTATGGQASLGDAGPPAGSGGSAPDASTTAPGTSSGCEVGSPSGQRPMLSFGVLAAMLMGVLVVRRHHRRIR